MDVIGKAVRDAFVTVTQIRSDRVSVLRVGSPKRSILQTNDLEVELQVDAGNSTEPSAAEVVRQFVESEQTDFTNELNNTPGVPPETTIENVSTKELTTAVRDTPNPVPKLPPSATPASSPPTAIPSSISNGATVCLNVVVIMSCASILLLAL